MIIGQMNSSSIAALNIVNHGTGAINISTFGGVVAIDNNNHGTTFGGQVHMGAITGHGSKGPVCSDASGNLYIGNNTGTGAPCP
jgi:hypothetical protein